MRNRFLRCLCAALLCLASTPGLVCAAPPQEFATAHSARLLEFPRDHGSHPEFQTEWWYFTGQLLAPDKRIFRDLPDFGFQLTFFRRRENAATHSPWDGGYLAHAAVTDVRQGKFYTDKRFVSGDLGLAGAAESDLNIRTRDWSARLENGALLLNYVLLPDASQGRERIEVNLRAAALPAPIAHGENGFSRKGKCETCASHYYSVPRIELRGEITIGEQRNPVQGLAWMDHEFMSNALEPDQAGWDWFSMMLEDGRDLMLFKLRSLEGKLSYASGTLAEAGRARPLGPEDFSIEELDFWKSKSGARYPSRWRVKVPAAGIDEILTPLLADQEVRGKDAAGLTYWEGAVRSASGLASGYVEMTGYDSALGARF